MKLISWNVNGIRAAIKKGFMDFLKSENPDIICIQETKARPEQVENEFPGYPYRFWNSAEKKGYSGTAIFSKIEPIGVTYGLDISKHYLVTVYVPNSKRDLSRLPYRQKEWDVDFLSYVRELENKKPVVFCGDMNVAQKEIDLANPKSNKKNAGFTAEERM